MEKPMEIPRTRISKANILVVCAPPPAVVCYSSMLNEKIEFVPGGVGCVIIIMRVARPSVPFGLDLLHKTTIIAVGIFRGKGVGV